MKNAFFILLLSTLSAFNAIAGEVNCVANDWAFTVEENAESQIKVGSVIFRNNVLDQVQMNQKPVDTEEYSELEALYEGETSEDAYKLFIFREKEEGSHISFLESESILGRKKVIELRCDLN